MKKDDKEIEIKVKGDNPAPLHAFLKKSAKYAGRLRQIDEYFVPAHRNFLAIYPVKEWLRLREENGKYKITYKGFYYGKDGKPTSCDEFETLLGDIDQARKIFKALNMRSIAKVDKVRRIWLYKDYEIALDRVSKLGDFVEIELKGASKNPRRTTDGMIKFLKGLGVGRIRVYEGYPFHLLFPDRARIYDA